MSSSFVLFFILTILAAVSAHGKMSGEYSFSDRLLAATYSIFCVAFAVITTLDARDMSVGRISTNVEKYAQRLVAGEVYEAQVVAVDGDTRLVLIRGDGETRVMRLANDTPSPRRFILDAKGNPVAVEDPPTKK